MGYSVFVNLFFQLFFIEQSFFLNCFGFQFLVVCTGFDVCRVNEYLTGIYQFGVNAFLQNLAEYLFKQIGPFETPRIVLSKG